MTLWGVGKNNSGEYLSSPYKILDEPIFGFVDENRFMKQDGSIWELSFSPVPVNLTVRKNRYKEGIYSFRGIEGNFMSLVLTKFKQLIWERRKIRVYNRRFIFQ